MSITGINIVLISTYELGRQPFGLASPAAWLRDAGNRVNCFDLAVEGLQDEIIAAADMVAFYIPMHTATRLATGFVERVRRLNPEAHLCFYGLYAPVNEGYLRALGAETILGGEFEAGLVSLSARLAGPSRGSDLRQPEAVIALDKLPFRVPARADLPELKRYAHVVLPNGETRIVGATEATRGCKHRCRHCPIVPVYGGRFFVVQPEVVLADIEQQVAAGAEHITFGDPDFFNGPAHAMRIVEAIHDRFPTLTYDVTIKVEHLLRHHQLLPRLRKTGCLFITSAVEAVDDHILEIFDKRHTREDFVSAVARCRATGVPLNPTFVAFNPWITLEGYRDLLRTIHALDLVGHVAPIQYAIRLLIPAGSRLLELPLVQEFIGDFDPAALAFPWTHPDPRVDRLQQEILQLVGNAPAGNEDRHVLFARVWDLTEAAIDVRVATTSVASTANISAHEPIPHLSEPWYC